MSSKKGGEYQVGVIGSFKPGEIGDELNELARSVGKEIARPR